MISLCGITSCALSEMRLKTTLVDFMIAIGNKKIVMPKPGFLGKKITVNFFFALIYPASMCPKFPPPQIQIVI